MSDHAPSLQDHLPPAAREYLARRLDGARDLYLLALAVGAREDGAALFGRMILEARIHFAAVIEECRIAGLDTSAIAKMLGKMNRELVDSIRPEIWDHLERLMVRRGKA
jgi:CRP-like cAMP-binding protein